MFALAHVAKGTVEWTDEPDRIIIGTASEHAKAIKRELYEPFSRSNSRTMFMDVKSCTGQIRQHGRSHTTATVRRYGVRVQSGISLSKLKIVCSYHQSDAIVGSKVERNRTAHESGTNLPGS
jgi:hypothetical protein